MTPSVLVLLAAAAYVAFGVIFGWLAGAAATHQGLVLWRLAAWVASGVVYAAHIGYLRLRVGRSTASSAWQAALAAVIGAFGLALVGPVRVALSGGHHGWAWLLALVLWPLITGVPAFLVGYATAALLARLARR